MGLTRRNGRIDEEVFGPIAMITAFQRQPQGDRTGKRNAVYGIVVTSVSSDIIMQIADPPRDVPIAVNIGNSSYQKILRDAI